MEGKNSAVQISLNLDQPWTAQMCAHITVHRWDTQYGKEQSSYAPDYSSHNLICSRQWPLLGRGLWHKTPAQEGSHLCKSAKHTTASL